MRAQGARGSGTVAPACGWGLAPHVGSGQKAEGGGGARPCTWGAPQSHCSPRSRNRFPHTGPPTSRSGSGASTRQAVRGFSTNVSRSARLQWLNFLGKLELRGGESLSSEGWGGGQPPVPWDTPAGREALGRAGWGQASPDAGRHHAAAAVLWHRAVAVLDVLVVVHAQVVAHLVGHGARHADGVRAVVLQEGPCWLGSLWWPVPRPPPAG